MGDTLGLDLNSSTNLQLSFNLSFIHYGIALVHIYHHFAQLGVIVQGQSDAKKRGQARSDAKFFG